VNLFILGSLMGELRPSARNSEEFENVTQQQEIKKEYQAAIKTNLPDKKANPSASQRAHQLNQTGQRGCPHDKPARIGRVHQLGKTAGSSRAKTNQPAPSTPTNSAAQSPAKPVEVIAKYFAVKGVTENAAKSAVTIQVGTKIYTISLAKRP